MKAILLVAGRGNRLSPYTDHMPKCLLPIGNDTPLNRLVRQLKKYGVDDIIAIASYKHEKIQKALEGTGVKVVVKKRYKTGANRYSMFLGIQEVMKKLDDVVIFEGDMVAEDEFVNYVTGTDFEHKTVWFTLGKFMPKEHGGILKTDGKGNVVQVRVVPKFEPKRYKITGVMRIAKENIKDYFDSLHNYIYDFGPYGYYIWAWSDRKDAIMGDASHYRFMTFNTIAEYQKCLNTVFDIVPLQKKVKLTKLEDLHPIEDYKPERFQDIGKVWKNPVMMEKDHKMILDGHHRYHLAKKMGLKVIPTIGFSYDEVEIWSLREELKFTKKDVINNALWGILYKYKTVKHKFPPVKYECTIPVEDLR